MKITRWDRFTGALAPAWTLSRLKMRATLDALEARGYEAAAPGRRTSGWNRSRGDANAVGGVALHELRIHARDLARNNGWARKARRTIANHTVGTGILPRFVGDNAAAAGALWREWAGSRWVDSEGRRSFYALQNLTIGSTVTDGEFLLRRRWRRPTDDLLLPFQIQALEVDHLDTTKNADKGLQGGPIVQGVEYDGTGERCAYWLFPEHPGSTRGSAQSIRIKAADVIHVFHAERAGQARGVSWFGAGIVPLKDLDEYEDASLVRQKIAACFAAFVKDLSGLASPTGAPDPADALVERFEPGMIAKLPIGKEIDFANPPAVTDTRFDMQTLRKVAAALGVTYEDLTGDYSQVNFSSGRLGRLAHWADVGMWQHLMLIPQVCDGVLGWFSEAAMAVGKLQAPARAEWTAPPMPMLDPDKEALAYTRMVRAGLMSLNEAVRERGYDPDTHWAEIAKGNAERDALGLVLDSDPRQTTGAGQLQAEDDPAEEPAAGSKSKSKPKP